LDSGLLTCCWENGGSHPCENLAKRQDKTVFSGEASRGLPGVTTKDCFQPSSVITGDSILLFYWKGSI